jgi:hypothetical protein
VVLARIAPSAPAPAPLRPGGENSIEWQQAQTVEFSGPTHKGLRV